LRRIGPKLPAQQQYFASLQPGKAFLATTSNFRIYNTFNGLCEQWENLQETFRCWVELSNKIILACSSNGLFLLNQKTKSATQLKKGDYSVITLIDNTTVACAQGWFVHVHSLAQNFDITNTQVVSGCCAEITCLTPFQDCFLLVGTNTDLGLVDWKKNLLLQVFISDYFSIQKIFVVNMTSFITCDDIGTIKCWKIGNNHCLREIEPESAQAVHVTENGSLVTTNL